MLACFGPRLGGESIPFGRHARVPDFPDPPVCPPRVEGACVADRRRPLPSSPLRQGANSLDLRPPVLS
jgi:hypothetical protein